jgi:hypothetical protein
MASALNGFGHPALMASTGAGLAPWTDLPAVRNQAAEHIHILVVNCLVLLGAELANADAAWSAASTIFALVVPAFIVSPARAAVVVK